MKGLVVLNLDVELESKSSFQSSTAVSTLGTHSDQRRLRKYIS